MVSNPIVILLFLREGYGIVINNRMASKADLDELDLLLITHLEVDARQTTRELSAKLGVSATTISKRIRKLADSGVIRFSSFIDPMAVGLRVKAFFGLNVTPGKSSDAAQHLALQKRIVWFNATTGRYDMMMYAVFRDNQETLDWLVNELSAVPGVIGAEEMTVLKTVKSHYHLLGDESGSSPEVTTQAVDEVELKLIRELELSPRESICSLAKKVSVSRWIAARKLTTLFDKKFTKVFAVVDPRSLGLVMLACIFVRTRLDGITSVAQTLAENQRIGAVSVVTGHFNIIANAAFLDMDEMSRFVTRDLGSIPGVLDHETLIMVGEKHWSHQVTT